MSIETEMAARKPWTVAAPDTFWVATGEKNAQHTFTDCLARVLPSFVTGTDTPVFELLLYGSSVYVPASSITSARELLLVEAKAPLEAFYENDQATIDIALAERDS